MRRATRPRIRGVFAIAILALLLVTSLVMSGCSCTPIDQPIEEQGGVESTGTVQADLSATTSGTADTTSSATATSTPEATPTVWPAKVGTFKKNFKKQVWYPTYVPKGFKIDSLDIVELDKGTGLVCDIVYLNGDNMIDFMQGSPKARTTDIVTIQKVPWGAETASLTYQIPDDPSTLPMIIYYKGGTLVELTAQGASVTELKKMAASMVPVN
jgi:hypothetical protein